MPIAFQCPSCKSPLQALEHLVGRTLKCYQCASVFNVPAIGEGSPPATFVEMKKPVVAAKPAPAPSPVAAFAPPAGDAPTVASPSPFEQEMVLTDDMMMTEEPKSTDSSQDSSSASGSDMYSLEDPPKGDADPSLAVDQLVEEPLSEDSSAGSTESQMEAEPEKLAPTGEGKSKVVAGLLQMMFPGVGRLYLGYTGVGLLQMFLGVCLVIGYAWSWIEGLLTLIGKGIKADAKGVPLK